MTAASADYRAAFPSTCRRRDSVALGLAGAAPTLYLSERDLRHSRNANGALREGVCRSGRTAMKTAQASSNNGVLRALVLGSALGLAALTAALYLGTPADAARPHVAWDMCSQTSGNPQGLECNSAEDALIRPKYADGTCGDWVCCPPNGDGSYNCDRGSSPGGSQISNRVKNLLGPRFTVAAQGQTPRRPRAPVAAAPTPARKAD
jgi:hypothetical protein